MIVHVGFIAFFCNLRYEKSALNELRFYYDAVKVDINFIFMIDWKRNFVLCQKKFASIDFFQGFIEHLALS